jgi:hypothetical protein
MKRFVFVALVAAALSLAPFASAQVGVGSSGSGGENSPELQQTDSPAELHGGLEAPDDDLARGRTPRTPGTGRVPGTGRTPGTERTPGTGRTPGTPRVGVTGHAPHSLPRTGVDAATVAMDGAALLGAGLLFLRARRRLATN